MRYKLNGSRQRGKRGGARCREQERRPLMRKQFLSGWIAAANPPLPSSSDDPPIIYLPLSDEDTTEFPPCMPSIEFLLTDKYAKVRLPEEIPAKVLAVHVHHHLSGQGRVSLDVRAWCMDIFRQIYPEEHFPDVPCLDFDLFHVY
jgi:hypothetical protein